MVLRVYNTLGKKKQKFVPRTGKKKVNMFVCGITPYSLAHIGHARTYVSYDIIAKYLRYKGYDVFYVQNVTDVDNNIITKAKKEGEDPLEFSARMTKEFLKDMKSIGVDAVSKYEKASDHIKDILRQVKVLHEKGYVYELDDGLYFHIPKFKEYGKLSGRKQSKEDAEEAVSKIDDALGKKDKRDFCVWKFSKPGEPVWETEVGKGRPGWHIEDTAIAEASFGAPQYDIHGGAKDLIFPHHEAEVTLMEAYSGKKPFVKYWIHTGFLNVEGEKMGKSKGNFITIRDALKKWDADVLRFMFISTKYSSPIDYSEASLKQAKKNLLAIRTAYGNLGSKGGKNKAAATKFLSRFEKYMDNDFNTPKVIALLLEMASYANKHPKSKLRGVFDEIGGVLGIDFAPKKKKPLPADLKKLIKEREKLRKQKKWKEADKIRDELKEKGVLIEDATKGTEWRWA